MEFPNLYSSVPEANSSEPDGEPPPLNQPAWIALALALALCSFLPFVGLLTALLATIVGMRGLQVAAIETQGRGAIVSRLSILLGGVMAIAWLMSLPELIDLISWP